MKILVILVLVFSFTAVQCQKQTNAGEPQAKAINVFLKDKTRIGEILPGNIKSGIVLIRCTRTRNSDGIFFTNFLFADPANSTTRKVKLSLTFDTPIDNCYCAISGTYKNLFQQIGNDKKEFIVNADSLSKKSVIRITIQSDTLVFTKLKGVQGKLPGYVIHEHSHDHHH